jgi:hypothetical protein
VAIGFECETLGLASLVAKNGAYLQTATVPFFTLTDMCDVPGEIPLMGRDIFAQSHFFNG